MPAGLRVRRGARHRDRGRRPPAFAIARRVRRRAGARASTATRPTCSCWPASCASSAPAFVQRYEGRIVNVHPSLLPAFTGLHTHRRAIEAGCKLAGATVHFVTAELDHGPIIAQAVVPVLPDDTEATLPARVLAREHVIYPRAVRWLVDGLLRVERRRRHAHAAASRSCCSDAARRTRPSEQARRDVDRERQDRRVEDERQHRLHQRQSAHRRRRDADVGGLRRPPRS